MGVRLSLRGSIQGVGFRPWVLRVAREFDVRGTVANTPDGVRIDAFGTTPALASFQSRVTQPALAGCLVDAVESRPLDAAILPRAFEIVESLGRSRERGSADLALAPDLRCCSDCLAELKDPSSRRYRYPFVTCAACGPRYTLAYDLPWDRVRTAMVHFPLCNDCADEYGDPDDRRFHAEAISCPVCGPALYCLSAKGVVATGNEASLAQALEVLRRGEIVAVQGVGGFHLACDAACDEVLQRLRARKRRPRRPLAVLVGSLADAEKCAVIDAAEARLLASDARPIVLLRRRTDANLSSSLAPGSSRLGLMLAYTPLHALLVEGFGGPLVMTSANRAQEPIVYRPDEAGSMLTGVADAVLVSDREIIAPCDDSVLTSARSGPIVLRRSRGYVPRPIRLAGPLRHSVLAFGGQWNNTVCVASGDRAWPSAHVGDVESPDSVARLAETVERWLSWLDIEPTVVAHDLHPGYESTRLALDWSQGRSIGVQHHHAHMAAVLGEHGVRGPALGLVWDGTGAGTDGSAWGGELLEGDAAAVRRLATFRPIPLAGGERAIREPWRLTFALLRDAFDGSPPAAAMARFLDVPEDQLDRAAALLERPELCVPAHGVGRYFDAIGALLLRQPTISYSGELAQGLNFFATGRPARPYPFVLETASSPWQIDLRPAVRALVRDLLSGEPPEGLADRFHATLAAAGEASVREGFEVALDRSGEASGGRARVVLAGGCFGNSILVDALESRLGEDFDVLRALRLPPGDGGLAFGQALVADAQSAQGEG